MIHLNRQSCSGFLSSAFTLLLLLIAAPASAVTTPTEKTLHSFASYPHGYQPNAPLIADAAGNLYGTSQGGGSGIVFKLTPGANGTWTETIVHNFSGNGYASTDGSYPSGGVIFDAAGNLYGTTAGGGAYGMGTVYKLAPTANGWKETILYSFVGVYSDGGRPYSGVVFDAAGNIYGTTTEGGNSTACYDQYSEESYGCGIAYELSPHSDGTWSETILYEFQEQADGGDPQSTLVLDKAGNVYGTTQLGGFFGNDCSYLDGGGGCGVLFRLSKTNGVWTETVLYTFTNTTTDGVAPPAGVVFDAQGNLYGLSYPGLVELSSNSQGIWTANVLYAFTGYPNPIGLPQFDSAGNVYGASFDGGTSTLCNSGCGTLFELSPNGVGGWTETTLYSFTDGTDGGEPSGMLRTPSGNLFATTYFGGVPKCIANNGCGAVFELSPSSSGTWTGSVVYDFPLSTPDGANPYSSMIEDAAGNLYGTTTHGGTYNFGTVFKLTVNAKGMWQTTVLYNFTNANGDGAVPDAGLIFDSSGNLYGTTEYGGNKCSCGTVFKLSPSSHNTWTETLLYSFQPGSDTTDGSEPAANLLFDFQGNLYGTTPGGGQYGRGTVFKLSPTTSGQWAETILYSFTGQGSDGEGPAGNVIFDQQGNLYGAAGGGESSQFGVVYKLSPPSTGTQWTETTLYSFTGNSDGAYPIGQIVFDAVGNLYGAAWQYGAYGGGEIFKLAPGSGGTWTKSVVHSFTGVNGDGFFPRAGLIIDSSGNLYGTTEDGGLVGNYGMVFELSPVSGGQWRETGLHRFAGGSDGDYPFATLFLDSHGNLYGTTTSGGNGDEGTVFEIKP